MQQYDTSFTSFITDIKHLVLSEGLYAQGGKKYKEAYDMVSTALDRLAQNWVVASFLFV